MKLNKIFANYYLFYLTKVYLFFSTEYQVTGRKKKTYKKRIKQILFQHGS